MWVTVNLEQLELFIDSLVLYSECPKFRRPKTKLVRNPDALNFRHLKVYHKQFFMYAIKGLGN